MSNLLEDIVDAQPDENHSDGTLSIETQPILSTQLDTQIDTQTEVELSLEDKFLQVDEVIKAESQSFPHVLVDEELLKEMASIPDRFGFKIGDVADILEIKQYVLRYWEQEFEILKPKKALNNQRFYTKKDVENAFLIRKLLYRDKFSIEGARQALKDVKFALKKEKDFNSVIQKIDSVQDQIKSFIIEIRKVKSIFN